MRTFRPSSQPSVRRAPRNAATWVCASTSLSANGMRRPTRRMRSACCAPTTTGPARAPKEPARKGAPVHLLDHLIGPRQHRRRDPQAEGLGRLEVDHELVLGGLLNGQIPGLGAFEDLVEIDPKASVKPWPYRSIGDEAPRIGEPRGDGDGRQPVLQRKLGDLSNVELEKRGRHLDEAAHTLRSSREQPLEFIRAPDLEGADFDAESMRRDLRRGQLLNAGRRIP